MTDMWTYPEVDIEVDPQALVGLEVEALDGDIGKIDEATDSAGGAYVVVDTGPWIFGRKVVLPAGTITRIDLDGGKVAVALTRGQIKDSPPYDPATYASADYRSSLSDYYGSPGE